MENFLKVDYFIDRNFFYFDDESLKMLNMFAIFCDFKWFLLVDGREDTVKNILCKMFLIKNFKCIYFIVCDDSVKIRIIESFFF